jgi:hypothetical protein
MNTGLERKRGLEIKAMKVFRELGGVVGDDVVKIAKSF